MAIDYALAAVLSLIPLLPYGPQYLGLDAPWAIHLGPVALCAVWLLARRRSGDTVRPTRYAWDWPTAAWCVLLCAVTGAALFGLSSDNRFESRVFLAIASDWLENPGRQRDVLHPLHAASVWFVFVEGFLVFALVRSICFQADDPDRRSRAALGGWLVGFALVAILAVLQYITRYGLHPFWADVNPALTRAHSTLDDPNSLASYLLLGLGVLLGVRRSGLSGWPGRGTGLVCALAGAMALFATVSRAAWLAVPMGYLIFVGFAPRPTIAALMPNRMAFRSTARRVASLGAVGIIAIVGLKLLVAERIPYQPGSPIGAIVQTLDPRVSLAETLTSRASWWVVASQLTNENPILGVGLGRFPREASERRVDGQSVPLENTHNLFLQIAAESGLVGLFVFLAWTIALTARVLAPPDGDDRAGAAVFAGAGLGWTGYLLTCTTGHPLLLPSQQIIVASLFGALLAMRSSHALFSMPRPSPRFILTAATLVLVYYGAGTLGGAPPPPPNDQWGYASGLHAVERGSFPDTYRWTSDASLIEVVISPEVKNVLLTFDVGRPDMANRPVKTTISTGDGHVIHDVEDHQPVRHFVDFPVSTTTSDSERRLQFELVVDPPFVPSEHGLGVDERTLGVQLLPLTYLDAAGMTNRGVEYQYGLGGLQQDDGEAAHWYGQAAAAGHAAGMANLAYLYRTGRGGLPQDDVTAARWYRQAADAGDVTAMTFLGFMYEQGQGELPRDDVEAVRWYRPAAEAGNTTAMTNLGAMFQGGRGGLRQNDEQAIRWYRQAAEAGNTSAMVSLSAMYALNRGGLTSGDPEAARWWRLAAEAGDVTAMTALAFMYFNGDGGLAQDDVNAVRWYRQAAELGAGTAMAFLGFMHEQGRGGLPQSDDEAVAWYRRAAQAGDTTGMTFLGVMYQSGRGGLPQDTTQAVHWYGRAAEAGGEQAARLLEALEAPLR